MRRETTFGQLPIGARFVWGHNCTEAEAVVVEGVAKTGPKSARLCSCSEHRFVNINLDKSVTWLDAPDDDAPAADPEPPAAADEVARLRKALRRIADMEPAISPGGFACCGCTEAHEVAREALGDGGETT